MDGLTPLQERFVAEYVKDLNASQAYQRAGYKARGNIADVNASRLLRNAKVADAVRQRTASQLKKIDITADRVLEESARLAFLDVRQLYEDDGSLKPVSQWPDHIAAAVAGIETVQQYEYVDGVKVPTGTVKKVKLWDKPGQLALLAKHLKLLQEDVPQTVVNIQINVRTSLAEALQHAYGNDQTSEAR